MADFVSLIYSFVQGLLLVPVPVLGISYKALFIGLWTLYFVGYFVMDILRGK